MKRICKRPIQIDALTICFSVVNTYHYDQIKDLAMGDTYSPYEYILQRVEGRYYNNIYNIKVIDADGESYEFGQLKFNLNNGSEEGNTHTDGTCKVWISLNNETLYSDRIFFFDYVATTLGFELHNVTTLDLCLDTPFNVSKAVWRYIKNKGITTILNGKKVVERDDDRPELCRIISGSLNKDKYMTLNVKQRNAIKDKSKGITVISYDKEAEIRNVSGKQYILDYYGNPKRLYRTEVHLNNEDINRYLNIHGIELTYLLFCDEAHLEDMFYHFLNSVIRFQEGRKPIKWEDILGKPKCIDRYITTTPMKAH